VGANAIQHVLQGVAETPRHLLEANMPSTPFKEWRANTRSMSCKSGEGRGCRLSEKQKIKREIRRAFLPPRLGIPAADDRWSRNSAPPRAFNRHRGRFVPKPFQCIRWFA
jgi:hypothetical protein